MEIRKLAESDYDQVIELYAQLDEYHVQARPDCFVHREKDKIYPKDAFIHNLSYPDGLELHTWYFNKGAISTYEAMGMTPQRYVFEKKL